MIQSKIRADTHHLDISSGTWNFSLFLFLHLSLVELIWLACFRWRLPLLLVKNRGAKVGLCVDLNSSFVFRAFPVGSGLNQSRSHFDVTPLLKGHLPWARAVFHARYVGVHSSLHSILSVESFILKLALEKPREYDPAASPPRMNILDVANMVAPDKWCGKSSHRGITYCCPSKDCRVFIRDLIQPDLERLLMLRLPHLLLEGTVVLNEYASPQLRWVCHLRSVLHGELWASLYAFIHSLLEVGS